VKSLFPARIDNCRTANAETEHAVLQVSDLTIAAAMAGEAPRLILENITFSIARGEVLGVLGESGAGKSTLALSLLLTIPQSFRIASGSILLGGYSLLEFGEDQLRNIRGNKISLVYQDSSVLNPVLRVQDQVAEVVRAHRDWGRTRCFMEARSALELVGLGDQRIVSSYPHQLSGGQRQRVAIAQALVCKPDLLIADEPTASLDPATTLDILNLLGEIRHRFGTAILLISHQPDTLAYLSDRVLVMYAGQIVEEGSTQDVFESPSHPYTRELLTCRRPLLNEPGREGRKPRWPYVAGSASARPASDASCVFENRCSQRKEVCAKGVPQNARMNRTHFVRCFDYAKERA
jgi:peptide/nickel transport system ATP-binding protein